MTDEEMAEEYENAQDYCGLLDVLFEEQYNQDYGGLSCYISPYIEQAYLAGLKAGRPRWHKVSEQIPTEEKEYLVKLTDGTFDVMTVALDGDLEPYLLTPKFDFYKDVEKWCEIPPEE
jgi:hypothetical protein